MFQFRFQLIRTLARLDRHVRSTWLAIYVVFDTLIDMTCCKLLIDFSPSHHARRVNYFAFGKLSQKKQSGLICQNFKSTFGTFFSVRSFPVFFGYRVAQRVLVILIIMSPPYHYVEHFILSLSLSTQTYTFRQFFRLKSFPESGHW
jgi:hypothetical protein